MKIRTMLFPAILLALFSLLPGSVAGAQSLNLKMAAYVPSNSPWDLGLKRLAADFDRISGGRVKLVFPQSLKASTEADIIQKMRLGLDGALLTTMGIAQLYPDTLAVAMPSLVRNDAEFDTVLEAVEPIIREKLSDRYELLAIARGGWIRYFSKSPIVYPEDLARMRMSVNPDDEKIQRLLQSIGTRTVKGDMSALFLQLTSNTVDSFYLSPVFLASVWSQYRGKVNYMSPFRVSPFIGAIIFSRQSWSKVPADLKPKLEEATRAAARRMADESEKIEEQAVSALIADGLKVPSYPADAEAKWLAIYADKREDLQTMFSAGFLGAIEKALSKAREKR